MIVAVQDDAVEALRALVPPGVEVRPLRDGLREAEFVVPRGEDTDVLGLLPELRALRVIQTLSAGTDWVDDLVPPWATLCNARGSHDIPVAEWVMAALLGAVRGHLRAARLRTWDYAPPRELRGMTVVVLGFGSIGRTLAARLEPFGVRVVGVASRARDGVHGVDELPALLPAADALVVLTPLTAATRGLVDARVLALLRDGALLVNAGRGPVVDTDALVAELSAGRIEAVLDVTEPEPLPDDHPLWDLCLAITPHFAGDSRAATARAVALAADQLGRYARGEPLRNVVRPATQG